MCDVVIIGATGLIGSNFCQQASDKAMRVTALVRRDMKSKDVAVQRADPEQWPDHIARLKPQIIVCALGSTWKKSGKDAARFRAIDYHLAVDCVEAAKNAGAIQAIAISSVGAKADTGNFYLRTKGEMEAAISALKFHRTDFLRPGLLRGQRDNDRRLGERIGIALAPVVDRLLPARWSHFRSVAADQVARACWAVMAKSDQPGLFIHHNTDIAGLTTTSL